MRLLDHASLAHMLYSELLADDDAARNVSPERSGVTVPGLNEFSAPVRMKVLRRVVSGAASDDEMDAAVGVWVELFQERGYVDAPPKSQRWRELARLFASVHLEALARSIERDRGDYGGKATFPLLAEPAPPDAIADAVPLRELFNGYIAELKLSGKGRGAEQRWRPVFDDLISFLGHDDASRVTRDDLRRWSDALRSRLAPRTVKNVYLASTKAVLTWAVDNGRIASNPVIGIKVRVAKAPRGREKGFIAEEACAVLRAAQNYQPSASTNPATRESEQMTLAKRWIPWLSAFTGARVAELAQLRKEDVRQDGEIHYVRITPDAGPVKTRQYRDVPLHPQLIELGFLRMVEGASPGPLFYRAGTQRGAKTIAERVSTWVRGLGVIGKEVAPSYGWRHRMKTIGRELGVDARVLDAIQGHAPRTAGEHYGDVTLVAKAAVISQFPWIR